MTRDKVFWKEHQILCKTFVCYVNISGAIGYSLEPNSEYKLHLIYNWHVVKGTP